MTNKANGRGSGFGGCCIDFVIMFLMVLVASTQSGSCSELDKPTRAEIAEQRRTTPLHIYGRVSSEHFRGSIYDIVIDSQLGQRVIRFHRYKTQYEGGLGTFADLIDPGMLIDVSGYKLHQDDQFVLPSSKLKNRVKVLPPDTKFPWLEKDKEELPKSELDEDSFVSPSELDVPVQSQSEEKGGLR